jgi:cation/acetate symporter
MQTTLGTPTLSAILCFLAIVALTLAVTYWAARRTRSMREFYAAGRSVSALQNGLALAGDYMSAASFLGITGLVALRGYDGMIYATGWLVGWPALMFLIAEPLRNLGKFTFADVVAFRLRQVPVRIASAFGGILTLLFYVLAQMVGAGNLIALMFGEHADDAGTQHNGYAAGDADDATTMMLQTMPMVMLQGTPMMLQTTLWPVTHLLGI